MTVKLAKFFSSASTAATAPPTSYQQQQQQPSAVEPHQHYNSYLDDDDNMSLYSTSASIMTSRDHPYNNSQRPLLAERKPQLLNKKKMNAMNAIINQPQRQQQPQQQQQQQQKQRPQPQQPQQQQQQQQKPYISPYVQRQKRDSAKGLHGFNDFDILSQQYNEHLQCSPHIGYPYGSPPSPTVNSNDFVFDALTTAPTYNGDSACDSAPVHHPGQLSFHYHSAAGNEEHADYAYYGNVVDNNVATASQAHYMGASSRFEDDFCCRRNEVFSTKTQSLANVDGDGEIGGPFIFGVSHATPQQRDLCRLAPAVSVHNYNAGSADTVIDVGGLIDVNKYTAANGQAIMHSTSDTSSSSRDSSSNKGAKFLLRKGKSKRNSSRDKQSKPHATAQPAQQPTIKCVVVGDAAVGKTNLILSYLENRFNTEHVPTASDIYNADVMVNDSPVHLTICDTAGQDTLDPLRELCYPDSDVFLLCFSVARPETFHSIKTKWAPKFNKTKAALILVGTQSDLRNNPNVLHKLQISAEKPISYADAWDLATTIGAKYIETSSVTQDKVKEVFDTAIWEGLAPTTLPPTPTPPLWKRLLCLA